MGLQDRDYWKERYDERLGVKRPQQPQSKGRGSERLEKMKFFRNSPSDAAPDEAISEDVSVKAQPHEFSFIAKLAISFAVALGCAIVYRLFR